MRLLLFALVLLPAALFAQTPTTVSFQKDFSETFYGKTITDPYRSLEDTGNTAVKSWLQQETKQSMQLLRSLPGYAALYQRAKKAIEQSKLEETSSIFRDKKNWYAVKRYPTSNNPKLYRYSSSGTETVVVDPERDHSDLPSKNLSLYNVTASASGRYLAYEVIIGGNEFDPLTVINDLKKGKKNLDPSFTNGRYFQGFDPEHDSVIYCFSLPYYKSKQLDQAHWWDSSLIYRRILGDTTRDELLIDFASQKIKRKLRELVYLDVFRGNTWALAVVKNMVSKELRIYATQKQTLSAQSTWKKVCDFEDSVSQYAVHGNTIYLQTYKQASRFKIISTSLESPNINEAVTVLPEQDFVIDQLKHTKDQLLVTGLSDAGGKLLAMPFSTGKWSEVQLPASGKIAIEYASFKESDFQFLLTSWVRTPELFLYEGSTGKIARSPIQKNTPVGTDEIEVKEVKVKSHDGVLIPMTIIHQKGMRLDGNNMVSMIAYGAYGMQDNPYFWPEDLVRYKEGMVRAVPHVRGGGIYGEDWHQAGQMTTKPNTWKDAIACAEYLIGERYTNAQKLMLSGASAGGIMVGRAITERPDLFRAATISVGCLDMVGAERSSNGYGNITEFGSVKTKEGFDALYEMSTYHQIEDGVKYPAILFNHGFNDNRVPVYHSSKTYARFREASASGLPVLLNIDFDSGHGLQESIPNLIQRFADNMAFFYMMMGKPGFELKKAM